MKNKAYPLLLLLTLMGSISKAQNSLIQNFQAPPNTAKPRVWWHWMNGNISKEGIKKDLDWMKNVGIGGFQNFDANLNTPVVVPKKLVFMQADWKEAFKFATEYANSQGLEMAIAGSPGWSVTGGPWVEPKDGMKKYVWTETRVKGGQPYSSKLPKPADNIGKFQDVPLPETSFLGGFVGERPSFYQDAFVFAYRLPENDVFFTELKPKLSSSGGNFSLSELTDGNVTNASFLPPLKVGEDMWIQYEFEQAQTFKAFSIVGANFGEMADFFGVELNRTLKVSDDGVSFKEIAQLSGSNVPLNTVSIPPTTAKYWRMAFKTLPPPFNFFKAITGENPYGEKSEGINVAEFVLHNTDRIDQVEDKAGFTPWKENNSTFLPQNAEAIRVEDVIDLTSKLKSDGSLEWQIPEGKWVIVRLGYSLTGRQNHPASPEATGLEVDKLDKEAVRKYINTYLNMYKEATGGLMGEKGLSHMVLDSYEAGIMNWTKDFPQEFEKRRGYSILTWLPVLTGRIVKDIEASEKFLWDFRKTIGEMIAENHYDVIGEELHKRGMKRYTEAHEERRIYLADGMDVKRNADIPMAAMWANASGIEATKEDHLPGEVDIREAASVAHIYGQPFVAAESMTASMTDAFSWQPEKLKQTADLEMASGLNRFVIHTSVHQPLDDKFPGFSLGPTGQFFTRHETWSEAGAKAWMSYLSRSSYLLQQGKHVADILYFYGENTNITYQFSKKLPKIEGYEYDFCNATALQFMKVENSKIIAPSGSKYSLLVLDESAKYMTLDVLKKIQNLVKAGAKIAGIKPISSPSLSDNKADFEQVINEIWGQNPKLETSNYSDVLKNSNIREDVIIKNAKAKILYVHRQVTTLGNSELEIYWLNNRSEKKNEAEISFRITGKTPEIWYPQTGKTEKISYQIKDGRTIIQLPFEPWDAYFIVFKENTNLSSFSKPTIIEKPIATILGTWRVNFQEGRGAPSGVNFKELISWTEYADTGVKYFSGTATYQNTFKLEIVDKKVKYEIDLGEVKNIAEVLVNGKNMGTLWKTPFKLDITEAVKKGINSLEIKVTNTWVNRLIGDAQPDVKQKITFTTMSFYKGKEPLLPSGLLGEVKIIMKK